MESQKFYSFSRDFLIDFVSKDREQVQEDTITLVGDANSGEITTQIFPASRLLAVSPLLRSLLPPPCPYVPRKYHVSVPGIPWPAFKLFHDLICFGKTTHHFLGELDKFEQDLLILMEILGTKDLDIKYKVAEILDETFPTSRAPAQTPAKSEITIFKIQSIGSEYVEEEDQDLKEEWNLNDESQYCAKRSEPNYPVEGCSANSENDKSGKLKLIQNNGNSNGEFFSNSEEELMKHRCKICGNIVEKSRLRLHTETVHEINIQEYKKKHGEVDVEKDVWHRCGVCGKVLKHNRDDIAQHIKKHDLPMSMYMERHFCENNGKGETTPSAVPDNVATKHKENKNNENKFYGTRSKITLPSDRDAIEKDECEVDKILQKCNFGGVTEYRIKWKVAENEPEDITWEPEENLVNASELLTEFLMKEQQKNKIRRSEYFSNNPNLIDTNVQFEDLASFREPKYFSENFPNGWKMRKMPGGWDGRQLSEFLPPAENCILKGRKAVGKYLEMIKEIGIEEESDEESVDKDGNPISSDKANYVTCKCAFCDTSIVMSDMPRHISAIHNKKISIYKEYFGELVPEKKVFHKCAICKELILFNTVFIKLHVEKQHRVSMTSYNNQHLYIIVEGQKKYGGKRRKVARESIDEDDVEMVD